MSFLLGLIVGLALVVLAPVAWLAWKTRRRRPAEVIDFNEHKRARDPQ